MMNFQKYSAELEDIMSDHEMVGIFKGTKRPKACDSMSCYECEFDRKRHPSINNCSDSLVNWMFREVRE